MESTEVAVQATTGGSARWARRAGWLLGLGFAVFALSSCLPPGAQKDATQVSAGSSHACAVVANGTVVCWGQNSAGQVGDGTTVTRTSPVPVPGLTGVTSLSAGAQHTCAVDGSGNARCWGRNLNGKLGDGTTVDRTSPVAVLAGVASVSAGEEHTCAVLTSGGVRCWGLNTSGQLGNNTTVSSSTPVETAGITNATSVSAGLFQTCARIAGGTAQCWGSNGNGGVGDGTTTNRLTPVAVSGLSDVVEVDSGKAFSCARRTDGTVWCWGESDLGQSGTIRGPVILPIAVANVTGATDLSVGPEHTCAVIEAGNPVCWGSNANGKLGNGGLPFACVLFPASCVGGVGPVVDREPYEVTQPDSILDSVSQVAAGGTHSCGVKSNGTIKCWGRGVDGQLGNAWAGRCTARGDTIACREAMYVGVDTPVPVVAGSGKLATARDHTCAVDTNQRMRCWGLETRGQLGNGTTTETNKALSVRGLTGVVGVSTGGEHTCAVLATGTVSCWGRALDSANSGNDGRLGYQSSAGPQFGSDEVLPVTVTGGDRSGPPAITTATQVALGARHSCALLADGTVRCWGANDNAQLGNDGAGASSMVPQIACLSFAGTCLEPLSGVVAISAGIDHTCALRGTGTVACWGSNTAGQVGPPPTGSTPTDIPGITGATLLASGDEHNCVALGAGGLRCWGRNSSGQFGDGSIFSNGIPQPTSGITGVVTSLDAGSMHTCAVVGGALSCWGENHRGQLGDGTTNGVLSPADGCGASGAAPPVTQGSCVPTPLAVTAVTGVATVTTGRSHTCAGLTNGQVRCWGGNDELQMGAVTALTPVLAPAAPVMPPGG